METLNMLAQIASLKLLGDGWYLGEGTAYDADDLDWLGHWIVNTLGRHATRTNAFPCLSDSQFAMGWQRGGRRDHQFPTVHVIDDAEHPIGTSLVFVEFSSYGLDGDCPAILVNIADKEGLFEVVGCATINVKLTNADSCRQMIQELDKFCP